MNEEWFYSIRQQFPKLNASPSIEARVDERETIWEPKISHAHQKTRKAPRAPSRRRKKCGIEFNDSTSPRSSSFVRRVVCCCCLSGRKGCEEWEHLATCRLLLLLLPSSPFFFVPTIWSAFVWRSIFRLLKSLIFILKLSTEIFEWSETFSPPPVTCFPFGSSLGGICASKIWSQKIYDAHLNIKLPRAREDSAIFREAEAQTDKRQKSLHDICLEKKFLCGVNKNHPLGRLYGNFFMWKLQTFIQIYPFIPVRFLLIRRKTRISYFPAHWANVYFNCFRWGFNDGYAELMARQEQSTGYGSSSLLRNFFHNLGINHLSSLLIPSSYPREMPQAGGERFGNYVT